MACSFCNEFNNGVPASEEGTLVCSAAACTNKMHHKCYVVTHVKRTLVCTPTEPNTILCRQHNKGVREHDEVQQIRLRFLTDKRDRFIAAEKAAIATNRDLTDTVPVSLKMDTVGTIAQMPLSCVMSSTSISDGGFVQRNISQQACSVVERSMREVGFNPQQGTITVVEIDWEDAEVKELKGLSLLPADFVPPSMPLVDMCPPAIRAIKGAWQLDAGDPKWEMHKRRFAVIDGNNRIASIVNILADEPKFMEGVSLNAHLVQVPVEDGLMVQLTSMHCNKVGGERINDTLADEIGQWQLILDLYCKFNPKYNWEEGKLIVTEVVAWIGTKIADIGGLLPPSIIKSNVAVVKTGEDLIGSALLRKVRLACKLPRKFVKWLQDYFAQMKGEERPESYGEQNTYCHHFLKMNFLDEPGAPELIPFLQWRVKMLDVYSKVKVSAWSTWSCPKQLLS